MLSEEKEDKMRSVILMIFFILLSPAIVLAHIDEPNKVDFVAINKEKTEVILEVVQHQPWSEETYNKLFHKVTGYLEFIHNGQIEQDHPEARGKQVVIEIAYMIELDQKAKKKLSTLRDTLLKQKIELRLRKLNQSK